MDDDLSVEMEPVEDLFGGGSRTKHVILKRKYATLSHSVFSCPVYDKISPNRDYPYEGMYSIIKNRYWKFIDTIATGLKVENRYVKLEPLSVRASPWVCDHIYGADDGRLKVSYYLYDTDGASGIVNASIQGFEGKDTAIIFQPFFDIRFMYDGSAPGSHKHGMSSDIVTVSKDEISSCIFAEGSEIIESRTEIDWKYKLGSGYRAKIDGNITFVPETRTILSLYEFEKKGRSASLRFSCAGSERDAIRLIRQDNDKGPLKDLTDANSIKSKLFSDPLPSDHEKAILARAIAMTKFGMEIDGHVFQEAGDFWFKTVWFRDQFEGLLSNYNTIKKISGTDDIKRILLRSYELQDAYGRIPNLVSPRETGPPLSYNSADASLLAFILAGKVVRDTNDDELARESASAFSKYLRGVTRSTLAPDGAPIAGQKGLLRVPSWHSWTDGRRDLDGYNLPIRVNEAWEKELISLGATEELNLQKFLLPEINAQWIRALESGWLFSKFIRDFKLSDRCKMFYYKALRSYKPVFFNAKGGYIYDLVTTDDFVLGCRSDDTPGSPGVVAASLLGMDVFTLRELESISRIVKERLLRTKWSIPFGIVVKCSGRNVYLNDSEYHEEVVWPRDTPYLIRLLRLTGEKRLIDDLLLSNLMHQMEEAFVFYNGEIFSCDHDLVPVKNPVQWWSQWVDPYLEKYA
ncbi:hypothetical protein CUJ83_05615 [Methanocella sp. CWC-04]|uniref:Glycogen debranching enzyme C-terminal domain-containing protein n=1 Tax=Methanooceanicella nereidis TaxID=2052831 RepID=A0AAP2W5T6_9EURY|nr:hypothetical protein [Methanocella sp. CWC-04]MCD1294477.1 hypothetical protein [Methanocella sp. CWC-04]